MSFDLDDVPAPERQSYSKEKLPPGNHLIEVTNIRQQMTHKTGLSFFLDFTVPTGPYAGMAWAAMAVCPEVATGGGGLSPLDAKKRDKQKIKQAVASILNVPFASVTTKVYDAVVAARGETSPVAGRKAILVVSASTKKEGATYYREVLPYTGDQPALPIHIQAILAAPPEAAPPVPSVPAPVVLPEGWQVHPSRPEYAYKGQDVRLISSF